MTDARTAILERIRLANKGRDFYRYCSNGVDEAFS